MSIVAMLHAGRQAAERLMVDECTITQPTDEDLDPVTGAAPRTVVYTGRCRVQTFEPFEARPVAGEHQFTVQRYSVHVPVGSYRPAVGDEVTMAAAALDPNLTDRVFRVVALLHKTAATAYRLAVEEV